MTGMAMTGERDGAMEHENPDDDALRTLLESARSIAMVGASSDAERPAHAIMKLLLAAGYDVIPVNPGESEVLGRRACPSLADVPVPVDIVDVFRRPDAAPGIAREAVAIGSRALWLQTGVTSPEAARIAAEAGLIVVMDLCIGQTVKRLGIRRAAAKPELQELDEVAEAGRASFPASVPPSWTPPGSAEPE